MKTERSSPPTAALEQAAEWYWQIRESDAGVEAIAAWQAWMQESADNQAAFAEIEWTLRQVDAVQEAPWPTEGELLQDHYDGSMPIAEWPAQRPRHRAAGIKGEASRRRFALQPRGWTMAASMIIVIAIGAIATRLDFWRAAPTLPDLAIYETQAAEHRDVHLADGSSVTLGGKSMISTAYTADSRLVILKHGAAFFDVAEDADRPFIVEAGGRRIAAVGTAFNVTRQVDRVVVTVTEGTVIVTPDRHDTRTAGGASDAVGSNDAGIARLEAGHQLAYNEQKVTPVTVADPADALAWREGRLKYRGESLRYVVDDVNRYAKRPITLADEAAGQVSFTGTVFEQSIDSWLAGLEQVFPVAVEETANGVVIRHRPKQPVNGKE